MIDTSYNNINLSSEYYFIFTFLILIVIAYVFSKYFGIVKTKAIIMILIIIMVYFYASDIIPFDYVAIAYLFFAILVYSETKNGSETNTE